MEQVVIAGGGPTGLMLACELRLGGADPVVLERLAGPSGESRAGGIHARTMEVLDMRGMLEPFLAEGRRLPGGHFAGIPLDFSGLPTRYPFLLAILQRRIERLLEGRARDLGVRLRREVEVTGLHPTADHVEIETTEGELTAEYVVGCDGGRSTVRKLAGIDFPGTPATMTAVLGDVTLDAPPPGPVFQRRTPFGNWSVLNFEPGWYRVITNDFDTVADRDAPITVADLRASLERHAGTDFGLRDPRWISRYHDAARLAARYRAGRVLLAGDAAHIHYPAGGQGLNTGVQDAVNLGWKLAAVLRGDQDQTLLDTYEVERRPVAERVLENTRAQTALTRPDEHTSALRSVVTGLIAHGDVNRSLSSMIAALDVRYPLPEGAGHHVPDLDLPDGSRLFSHLHDARPVLLGDAAVPPHVRRVPYPGPPTLIRPDGHVAWVESLGAGALREAVDRWC
ncbi:FAD-dependent monooxygenase [Actinoplanes sp. CA-030573]|uniref:FAD-dependent monooxygenase n=1 Tax=Actinoplanes sp. CA-030573 TaxID=3239898 RepID=UPI003D8D8A3A